MTNKDFDSWNIIKKKTEEKTRAIIKKGGIYWCRLGVNIGVEEDGKNTFFKRPILILKKFSHEIALVVPLTTQKHNGDWYYHFTFNGINQWAILNQAKSIDVKRFEESIGELSSETVEKVLDAYMKLIKTP